MIAQAQVSKERGKLLTLLITKEKRVIRWTSLGLEILWNTHAFCDGVVLGMPFPFPFPGPAGDISGGPVVSEGKAGTQHIWSRICPVSKSHFFHLPHSSVSQRNESSQTSPSQTVTSMTGLTQDRCFMQAEKENKGTVAKISQVYRGR